MTTKEAWVYFSSRAHMLPSDQHHFQNKREYIENECRCVCREPDLQAHLLTCSSYLTLQEGLDTRNRDLVKFYQHVIKARKETEDN